MHCDLLHLNAIRGGAITASSKPGQGDVFKVTLPLHQPSSKTYFCAAVNQPFIIFAEDDLEDQIIIGDAFLEVGYPNCFTFLNDGISLLEYLAQPDSPLPSLIVLDLNMPKMNGTEVLAILKQEDKFKDIPVIIFSTSANLSEKERCLSLGAKNNITKPITHAQSLEKAHCFYTFISN